MTARRSRAEAVGFISGPSRALIRPTQSGISRCSAFRAVRHSALFGIRAVRHFAPFGIPRRSAFAPFGIRALRHFAPFGISRPLAVRSLPVSSPLDCINR